MANLATRIKNRLLVAYVGTDLLTTSLAFFLFNCIRASHTDWVLNLLQYYRQGAVIAGQVLFPLMMMGIYWLSGYYNEVRFKSRTQEFVTTFWSAAIGALLVFFLAMVNDVPHKRTLAIMQVAELFALLFVCVYSGRYLITCIQVGKVHSSLSSVCTVMFGTDARAIAIARNINSLPKSSGMTVTAFVDVDQSGIKIDGFDTIPLEQLHTLCEQQELCHGIISPEIYADPVKRTHLLRTVLPLDMSIYVVPDIAMHPIASRRSFDIKGEPLVCISSPNVPAATANVKRLLDILLSIAALVVLSPLFAIVAIIIKMDDGGDVFFTQTRMGRRNRPFRIFKFRTMRPDEVATGSAPLLTATADPRITRPGAWMRKYRIDEVPQFVNVLRGEMSIVGPRPEQRYFAEQIASRVPYYHLIYQVRPGITSWGMVKYGYASDVDQMVERLRYDLIYLQNISLSTDLKILLHTLNTIAGGKGK